MLLGLNTPFMGSTVKQILNRGGEVTIVLESGLVFTREEVEDYFKHLEQ